MRQSEVTSLRKSDNALTLKQMQRKQKHQCVYDYKNATKRKTPVCKRRNKCNEKNNTSVLKTKEMQREEKH